MINPRLLSNSESGTNNFFVPSPSVNIFVCCDTEGVGLARKMEMRGLEMQRGKVWIYIFPEKELCGLSPNFNIHVSVSDQYIPTVRPTYFSEQNRQTDQRNI
jgi:hypothetical protein